MKKYTHHWFSHHRILFPTLEKYSLSLDALMSWPPKSSTPPPLPQWFVPVVCPSVSWFVPLWQAVPVLNISSPRSSTIILKAPECTVWITTGWSYLSSSPKLQNIIVCWLVKQKQVWIAVSPCPQIACKVRKLICHFQIWVNYPFTTSIEWNSNSHHHWCPS